MKLDIYFLYDQAIPIPGICLKEIICPPKVLLASVLGFSRECKTNKVCVCVCVCVCVFISLKNWLTHLGRLASPKSAG